MDTEKPDKSDKPYRTRFYQKAGFVFTLINIAIFVQFFNMQYLASSMRGLEMELGFSPGKLCTLVVGESVSSLVSVPIWGILADLFEIKYVLMVSIFLSGLLLLLFGWLDNLFPMLLVRILNGFMMGSAIPSSQKYVAISNMKNTGYAFGIFHATSNLGRLICSIAVTKYSAERYFNMIGWRLCSFGLGCICIVCSAIVIMIPKLKPKNYRKSFYDIINLDKDRTLSNALRVIWKRFLGIMSGKTIRLLNLTVFLGQGPYTAAYFTTLYFQYCRLSNLRSGITAGVIIIGSAGGGVLGGLTTDKIHNRYPRYGRLMIGLISGTVRVVGFFYVLFVLTFDNMLDRYPLLVFSLFIIGMTFASIAIVDRAVVMDVLLPSEQSFGVGAILFVSGTASALLFPPVLSFFVKNVFGYQEVDMDIKDMEYSFLRNNAFALRNGIAVLCIFSSICSAVMYCAMMATYCKLKNSYKHYLDKDAQAIKDKISEKTRTSKLKVVTDKSVKMPNSRQETIDFII